MNQFLYYCLAIPISSLPLGVIYFLSHLFYLSLCSITPYRKKVIDANIRASFPNLSQKEVKRLRRKFYRYFAYLMAESVKLLTINEKHLKKRLTVKNPEVMSQLFQENRNVILLSSHLNNWEMIILGQDLIFQHKAIGIGMPLTNPYWNKKITAKRERFGMLVANALNYKEKLNQNKAFPTATLVLNDQNPGKDENCYWTTFLNQETAFYFGAEIMANEMNMAVVYGVLNRKKRGYYEMDLELISSEPLNEVYGFITEKYVRNLESDIINAPANWLWSHKRWKKNVPKNIAELKNNHQRRFNQKFRN